MNGYQILARQHQRSTVLGAEQPTSWKWLVGGAALALGAGWLLTRRATPTFRRRVALAGLMAAPGCGRTGLYDEPAAQRPPVVFVFPDSPDLGSTPDLIVVPDLATVPDLSRPDFSRLPDLGSRPDLRGSGVSGVDCETNDDCLSDVCISGIFKCE